MQIEAIVTLLPVLIGLVEVTKKTGVSKRFLWIISVVLGAGFSAWMNHSLSFYAVVPGIVTGLAACGLYSGVKTSFKG